MYTFILHLLTIIKHVRKEFVKNCTILNSNLNALRKYILTFFLISTLCFSEEYVAQDLLNFFGSSCPSQGSATESALNDARALIDILDHIKDDPDCISASENIAKLGGLSSKIQQLQNNSDLSIRLEKIKAEEVELILQLSQTTDPNVQDQIKYNLRSVQVEKASLLAENAANKKYTERDLQGLYSQIIVSTNSAYTSIVNNTRCLNKNPNLLNTATSLVTAIGGAVAVVNPAIGLGISAFSVLFGTTVEAIRTGKINRQIRKISDSSLVSTGFKCALESLSNRYCEINDALNLLQLKFNYTNSEHNEGFLEAMHLYDRNIPAVLFWLDTVHTGSDATTSAESQTRILVYRREGKIKEAKARGQGAINEKAILFDKAVTPEDKYNILKSLILTLTNSDGGGFGNFSSSDVSNPLFEIYDRDYAPYYLLGFTTKPVFNERAGRGSIPFSQFEPFNTGADGQWTNTSGIQIPDYQKLRDNYNAWILKAQANINLELQQATQPDVLKVFTDATDESSSPWKVSARDSIKKIISFLRYNKPNIFNDQQLENIYSDTLKSLRIMLAIIDEALGPHENDESDPDLSNYYNVALRKILTLAKLDYGNVFFSSRLEMVVRISIDEYLKNRTMLQSPTTGNDRGYDVDGENIALQFYAAKNYIDTLKKISGNASDEYIEADLENSQSIALSNMKLFIKTFGDNINSLLKATTEKISNKNYNDQVDETYSNTFKKDLIKICSLVATMPLGKSDVKMEKYCKNVQLAPFMINGPKAELIDHAFLSKNISSRACSYRDFIRKSKIYRERKINFN